MQRTFTDEELQRMGLTREEVNRNLAEHEEKKALQNARGWTRQQISNELHIRGFNSIAEFERACGLAKGSVNQAMYKRFPKVDKLISSFLNIPLHELWPNQYLANGVPMNYRYRAETMTDEELAKLNHSVMNPKPKRVVTLEDQFRRRQQASLPPGIGD